MSSAPHPEVVIQGKLRRLAPGARIWNTENLIEMPAALNLREATVNYTEDADGAINRIWILTPEEARRPVSEQTNSNIR